MAGIGILTKFWFAIFVGCTNTVSLASSLKHLGTANGKTFFAQDTPRGTWNDANTFCQKVGMKLASIRTKYELETLVANYNTTAFSRASWTAGRVRDWSWHDDNDLLDSSVYYNGTEEACVLLYNSGEKRMGSFPCRHEAGILCETYGCPLQN